MSVQQVVLTSEWQELTITGTRAIIQGSRGSVWLGTSAPSESDAGLVLVDNIPVYVDISVFTSVHVKGSGVARVAAA